MDHFVDQYVQFLTIEKGLASNTIESYHMDLSRFMDFLEYNGIKDISESDTTVLLKYIIEMRKEG